MICLGHPAPTQVAPINPHRSLRWQDLTMWVPADCPTGQ